MTQAYPLTGPSNVRRPVSESPVMPQKAPERPAGFRMADARSARGLRVPQAQLGVSAPVPASQGALTNRLVLASTGQTSAARMSRAARRVHDDLVTAVNGNFAGYVTDGYEEDFAKALTAAGRLSADEQYAVAVALEKATARGRMRVGDRPFYEKAMSEMMEPPRRKSLASFVLQAIYNRPALSVSERISRYRAIRKQPRGKEGDTHGGWDRHHQAQAEALVRSAPTRDHRAFVLELKSRELFDHVREDLGAETQGYFDSVEITAEYAAEDYSVEQRLEKIQTLQADGARNIPEKMEALFTSAPAESRSDLVVAMEKSGQISFAFQHLGSESRAEVSALHQTSLYDRADYDAAARAERIVALARLRGPLAEQRSSLLETLLTSTPAEAAPEFAESIAQSGLVERAYGTNAEATANLMRAHLTSRPHGPADRAKWLSNVLKRASQGGKPHHRTELEALLVDARGTKVADALVKADLYGALADFGRSENSAIRDQAIALAKEVSTAELAAPAFQATRPSFDEELSFLQDVATARSAAFASAAAATMHAAGAFPFMSFSYRLRDVDSRSARTSQLTRFQNRFDANHADVQRLYDALPPGQTRESLKKTFSDNHVQSRLDEADARIGKRLESYLHFRSRADRFTDRELGDHFEGRFQDTFDRDQAEGTIDANFRRVFAVYEEKVELRDYRDDLADRFPSDSLGRTYRDEFLEEFSLGMSKTSLKSEFDTWYGRHDALLDGLKGFPNTELGNYYRDEFYGEVSRTRFTMSRSSIRSKASTYQNQHHQEVQRRESLDREFNRQYRSLRNSVPAGYVQAFERWWAGQDYDLTTTDIRRAASRIESDYADVVSHYQSLRGRLPSTGDYRSRFERFWNRNDKDVSKSDLDSEFRKLMREHEAEEERKRRAEEERNRRPGSGGSSGGNSRPGSGSGSGSGSSSGNKRPGSTNQRPGSSDGGNRRPGSTDGRNKRPGST